MSASITAIAQASTVGLGGQAATLTEGTAVSVFALCAQDITGQTVQFAGARGYSDKLIIVTRANFIEGALESLVRELAFKIDRFSRVSLSANTTLRVAGAQTKAFAATADGLFGKNVAKIAPFMDANNVPRWEDETFPAVINPLAQFDIFRDASATGFVSVARYGERTMIYKGEVGQMYGVRFLLSNAIPRVFGTAATTAAQGISAAATGSHAWVFAPDAFYSIELEDGGVEVIHHPPGSSGSVNDPANQIGSIAVKVHYGVVSAPSADQRLMRYAYGLNLHF